MAKTKDTTDPPAYDDPCDTPPGADGYQTQHPDWDPVPVPVWDPGENPPGTNPPVPPVDDPATTLPPGTMPGDPDTEVLVAPLSVTGMTQENHQHSQPGVKRAEHAFASY